MTTEDESSNLLSPLGKRKGVEVVPHRSHPFVWHTYKRELSPAIPTLSLLLSFRSSLRSLFNQAPPTLLSSSRCLSSWISFWTTPLPLLVPSSFSTSFFMRYISSAFLRSAISPVLGMRQYPTFGSRHTFFASNNAELSTHCSQNMVPLCASVRTR